MPHRNRIGGGAANNRGSRRPPVPSAAVRRSQAPLRAGRANGAATLWRKAGGGRARPLGLIGPRRTRGPRNKALAQSASARHG
ncbi:MAG: hypothetical protein OXU61_00735 [Gammaproteobacteria bacterium]|nr:hypothetical protein [Gammaproteobacteria bacterium]